MKASSYFLLLGLGAAGLLTGYAGNRLTQRSSAPEPENVMPGKASDSHKADATGQYASPASRTKTAKSKTSIHSTDTLESIIALEGESLYGRLALWLMDASEQDIATYWESYSKKNNLSNDITDLVFINWTRLDPAAAISAVAGTSYEHYAWWAWACHNPQAALAAAMSGKSWQIGSVAWGIGEFHPDWLRAHFAEIPESARGNAISGLVKWDDTDKPLETLEFLKKNGNSYLGNYFETLTRKDPWAAYDWLQKNNDAMVHCYGNKDRAMEMLVKTMGESQPDALQRLADLTPPGEAKRKMDAVLFENLLKTDPEAAMEQAKNTKAPRNAAERLASVGMSLANTDPDKAFEMARSLFSIYPDAMNGITWVHYDHGASGSGTTIPGVEELVGTLLAKDPEKLMALQSVPDASSISYGTSTFNRIATKWAEQDLAAFSEWANRQDDPAIRNQASSVVIDQLDNEQQYADAIQWAMSSDFLQTKLNNILYNWNRTDPVHAQQWLESANLPEQLKNNLRVVIKRTPDQ